MAWMEQRKLDYLDAMGIQVWKSRFIPAESPAVLEDSWDSIQQQTQNCQACALHTNRTHTTHEPAHGRADWLLIGLAPGQADPFVGPSKALLSEMLRSIGIKIEQTGMTHLLKCPLSSRQPPKEDEIKACMPFIQRQLALLKPKIILVLGAFTAQSLLNCNDSLETLRTQTHYFENIPLRVTYLPEDLLRFPLDKRKAWDDLRSTVETYAKINLHV